jgi:DNA helicase-2/ATP-dependent DNA helicase PcrA
VAFFRVDDQQIKIRQGTVCKPEGWTGDYRRGLSSFIRALPQDVIEHRSFVSSSVSPEDAILGLRPFSESMDLSGADSPGLKPGDRVNHPAFGLGVVSRFLGEDKVEVIFRERGTKLLHLGYTILEKI